MNTQYSLIMARLYFPCPVKPTPQADVPPQEFHAGEGIFYSRPADAPLVRVPYLGLCQVAGRFHRFGCEWLRLEVTGLPTPMTSYKRVGAI